MNTLQGSGGQDSKGETVCDEAVVRDCSYRAGGGGMGIYEMFPFLIILPAFNWSVRAYGYFKVENLMNLFAFSLLVTLGLLPLPRFPLPNPVA